MKPMKLAEFVMELGEIKDKVPTAPVCVMHMADNKWHFHPVINVNECRGELQLIVSAPTQPTPWSNVECLHKAVTDIVDRKINGMDGHSKVTVSASKKGVVTNILKDGAVAHPWLMVQFLTEFSNDDGNKEAKQ